MKSTLKTPRLSFDQGAYTIGRARRGMSVYNWVCRSAVTRLFGVDFGVESFRLVFSKQASDGGRRVYVRLAEFHMSRGYTQWGLTKMACKPLFFALACWFYTHRKELGLKQGKVRQVYVSLECL